MCRTSGRVLFDVVGSTMFNPVTAPACKISGLTSEHMSANSIFDGTTLNTVHHHFDRIFLCAHVKGKKGFNDFKFGTFIGCFKTKSDSVASMAVKGLTKAVNL